jgi:hypothetical protein
MLHIIKLKNKIYYYNNKNHIFLCVFVDDTETRSIRILKKEEALAKVQATVHILQEETEEIQKQIKKERQQQIEDM